MEADIEDDQDILEDGESAEDAGFAVGDVPPVTKHAGQDGHQVEEQEDLLQHQYVWQLVDVLFQTAVTGKSCVNT